MLAKIVAWLLARGLVSADHLLHPDGATYMERYWIFTTRFCSLRLHRICTADLDRHLHDHPWDFVSLVLSGRYFEARPATRVPCFNGQAEATKLTIRGRFSIARRKATDRHRIICVDGDVWTLILLGPLAQWWGFYTPSGKIYWRDYPSCHHQVVQTDDTN